MSKKEWHVEPGLNPFSLGSPEFVWRLREEKGWFELWTKQEDTWSKARQLARKHRGRALLHRKGWDDRRWEAGKRNRNKRSERA